MQPAIKKRSLFESYHQRGFTSHTIISVMQKRRHIAESLQNFRFYIAAAPDAKNIRDVK
jgi:hypothetical protein